MRSDTLERKKMPGQQPRSLLIKPASGDCNLHCTYCFYHERATDPYKETKGRRMRPEILDELIKQGMRLDRRQATFGWQGGEPTLMGLDFFKRAVSLQQKYGVSGQSVSNGLQTNGILLDEEWARFLRRYNFLVGVSLDGPAPYHDHYRRYISGAPTHEKVVENMHMLDENDVQFNVLAVVNDVTAQHGAEIFDYFLSEGFYYMQFIPCVEVDPETGELTDFSVEPDALAEFLCTVFDKWYNDGEPEASIRDFDAILAAYVGQEAPMCCYQKECGSYVAVEYNGDIYPCDFFVQDDLFIGNLRDMSLEEAFESEKLRRFASAKSEPRPECQECVWLPLCNQGCPRFVGVEGRGHHYHCRAYKQFFTHSHDAFMDLRRRVLQNQGVNPHRAPKPPIGSIGRNDPCPCGSGKKYKQCCGRQ
ncbi:MAG: anaerobic sulfatase maturase [Chloroflexota bacterium]